MRRRNPARVLGPYQERGRWRLIVVEEAGRRSVFFPTQGEALKFKAGTEREITLPPSRRIGDVLAEWQAQRHREGQCKAKSIDSQFERLQGFFATIADEDIAALTPRRAAALYQEARERISPRTGRPLAAATHRLDLQLAQCCYGWAIRQGYVGASPFRDVRPAGKVKAGKQQLRIEEARRFTSAALRYFQQTEHPLAIGALLALMMGLRTSEVLDRVVRDVDDGGRYLWIDSGKMTERHYAQGSAVGNADTARVMGRLGEERGGRPSVREQLEQLDESELARLLELLSESKKGGTPANWS